jgi:hypothetical protein
VSLDSVVPHPIDPTRGVADHKNRTHLRYFFGDQSEEKLQTVWKIIETQGLNVMILPSVHGTTSEYARRSSVRTGSSIGPVVPDHMRTSAVAKITSPTGTSAPAISAPSARNGVKR